MKYKLSTMYIGSDDDAARIARSREMVCEFDDLTKANDFVAAHCGCDIFLVDRTLERFEFYSDHVFDKFERIWVTADETIYFLESTEFVLPIPNTVDQFYRQVIGRDYHERYGLLYLKPEEMPCDTPCGEDCVDAIIKGSALLDHALHGYGPTDYGVADAVARATWEICAVYING